MSLMASKNVLKVDRGVIAHHWKNTKGCWSVCALIFPLATFYPFFKSSLLVTHFQLPFTLFTNTVCVRECRLLHVTALGWIDVCLTPWVPGIHLRLTCLLRKRHHLLSHLTGWALFSETHIFTWYIWPGTAYFDKELKLLIGSRGRRIIKLLY